MFEHLMTPTQRAHRDELRAFVKSVPRDLILAMDRDEVQFPKEFLQEAGKLNLLGPRYPVELGGRGLQWVDSCMAMEEIGALGYVFACVFGVGAELVCDAIVHLGTDDQKERFVRPLLAGKKFAAECLTEPRGGSDFFGAASKAVKVEGGWLLNGAKRFIVGGSEADFFLVYARTNPDVAPHKGMTCFLVERGPGVTSNYLYGLMGCRGGGTARVMFHNVFVPDANVLAGVNRAVDVFYPMMIPERLGTAAMTIGAARPAVELATRYTSKRKAFGQPIKDFQGVGFQVADAVMLLDASRALVYTTARAVDAGDDPNRVRRFVSEAKRFVTSSCQQAARNAMQVMGGIGYTNIYPVERIVRDLSLASIWTGTNEVMALIVQTEWYKEYARSADAVRDPEPDAEHAFDEEEKVYE